MIPYNPSSFNTNKTILEQILELKKWLKEHPSYAVYTTYIHYKPAENVDYFFTEINGNPDFVDNIAVGDLLWFGDGYISPIASITIDPNDRENSYVTISQPVTSLIGPTGPQGPRGYDGVSVTNASVNASGYLIITLSNGLTVNTGYVVGPQGPQGPTGATGPQGPTGPTGADGNDGVSITNVTIDGNSHLIVTLSDGSTIDAGSVSSGGANVVTLSTTSGTLTPEEFATLQEDDSVIIYNGGYYRKHYTSNSSLIFVRIYNAGSLTYERRFDITISTRAYSHTEIYLPISADNITSFGAANGQVLQANGSGGASWQNAGGIDVVDISSNSGYIGVANVNKLKENNCLLYRTDLNRYYYKVRQTTTQLIYESTDDNGTNILHYRITITISGGAYSTTSYGVPVSINPATATNGQVFTADGNGNASWQNAGGTTLNKYQLTNFNLLTSANLQRFDNIIKNAKGNIYGNFYIFIDGDGRNLSITQLSQTSDSIQLRIGGTYLDNWNTPTKMYIYSIRIYNNTVSGSAKYIKLDDNSINNCNLGSVASVNLTYYNDTEILS